MDPKTITYTNMYNFCSDAIQTENSTLYKIGHSVGNSVMTLAIDEVTKKIYKYSNEYLHLLSEYYRQSLTPQGKHTRHYSDIVKIYQDILLNPYSQISNEHANKHVVSLATSFSRGTVHGYSGLFCILEKYINQRENFKDYHFLVWEGSQRGLIEIIKEYISKNIIPPDRVIYIKNDVTYRFRSMHLLYNNWHMFPFCVAGHTNFKLNIIRNILIDHSKYAIDFNHENLCIIKSSESTNLTGSGIVSAENIREFCSKYNFVNVEPAQTHEIELMNRLYKCKVFVTSWGTAWFKNGVYLSDNCTDVYVLVIGPDFHTQFQNGNRQPTIRKAKIHYILLDDNSLTMPENFMK